jgi:hypothetical protein
MKFAGFDEDEPQGAAPARRPRTGSPEDKGYRRRKQVKISSGGLERLKKA